jgi:hypothetical protein
MRILLSLLFAFSLIQLAKAQNRLGVTDNPILTEQEGQFLDSLLQEQRGRFEFPTKRVAFLYGGSTGNAFQPKSTFFHQHVLPWTTTGRTPVLRLVKLTEAEKKASGGYDALVVAWAKVFTARQKEKMLKLLAHHKKRLDK